MGLSVAIIARLASGGGGVRVISRFVLVFIRSAIWVRGKF